MKKSKVLIIDFKRNGYGVAQSLAKKQHYIIGCDVSLDYPSFRSRYIDAQYLIDGSSEERIVSSLIEIGKEEKEDEKIFLIPTNDTYLYTFSKYFADLEEYYIPVFETDFEKLMYCSDKRSMYKLAREAGVKIPLTYNNSSEIENYDIPKIIKPSIKTIENKDRIPFRNVVTSSRQVLSDAEEKCNAVGIEYVIQDFIPGDDSHLHTAGLVMVNGKIYAAGSGKKIRQFPNSSGMASYATLTKNEELIDIGVRFMNHIKLDGIHQVEFKEYNGEYYLMEINPRIWLWHSLFETGGLNLPDIYINAYKDVNYTRQYQTKYEGTWMAPLMDFKYNFLKNKNVGLFQYLKGLIYADKYGYGDKSDMKVFLKQLMK